MIGWLGHGSQVTAFLQDARERPEDDTPRLVLADYLEDHGDPERAEFIRLQCRLAAGQDPLEEARREQMEDRCERLLAQRGGGWLGPLWQWVHNPMSWHRGLLSVRLPRECDFEGLVETLPWIDTAFFIVHGLKGFLRVADLMGRSSVNHLHIDLRSQMGQGTLLELLAGLPESASLRSLGIHWPLAMLRRLEGGGGDGEDRPLSVARVGADFLSSLLGKLPVGKNLTHLGTSRPFGVEQAQVIRGFGVVPVHVQDRLWMHRQPPLAFRARGATPSSSCLPPS